MKETVGTEKVIEIIRNVAKDITRNVDYLTRLDQAVGDGDHGINLMKGFRVVDERLSLMERNDVGEILKDIGMTLISNVGGTAGPLYGVTFIRAGEVVKNKNEVNADDLANMIKAAEQGIIEIGEASLGDKTMLDAIHPAVITVRKAVEQKKSLIEALEISYEAAVKGMESTSNMVSKRGRSSYLGERSRGHIDVGAMSVCIIFKSAIDTLKEIQTK